MFQAIDQGVRLLHQGETTELQVWGKIGFRLRIFRGEHPCDIPGAVLNYPHTKPPQTKITDQSAVLYHGQLKITLSVGGQIELYDCERQFSVISGVVSRAKSLASSGLSQWRMVLKSHHEECFYGLGQHRHGYLDQKGCVLDLEQRNSEVSVPLLVSSRGYSLLWNMPGTGRVELAENSSRWIADGARSLDIWLACDPDFGLMQKAYFEVTGQVPAFPSWASGFWQCKLRYENQQQLLDVAREYKRRQLPISVIVVDYFHWPTMGDFCFDHECWPDPQAMVDELKYLDIELMVSVWPSINPASRAASEMEVNGYLLDTQHGSRVLNRFIDTQPDGPVSLYYYDPSNAEARADLWRRIQQGYRCFGIKLFWLDACEPELSPVDFDNLSFRQGSGTEVAQLYPKWHQQTFFDGLSAEGEVEVLTLCRSAWAGSQALGAAVWSGDIPSTFESLQVQLAAGLNMAMSGIPWWTTDIGGFYGGDPSSDYFQELIVRWFQFGVFCPIFRLHGKRDPGTDRMGADNELWSFGEKAYPILVNLLQLREQLRPHIHQQLGIINETGRPLMRPLFFDFPDDGLCYRCADQLLFGDRLLVAPVLYQGEVKRRLYLPAGVRWRAWQGEEWLDGGQWVTVDAPLHVVPVFVCEFSALQEMTPS